MVRVSAIIFSILFLLSVGISTSHFHAEHSDGGASCSICHVSSDKKLKFLNSVVVDVFEVVHIELPSQEFIKFPIHEFQNETLTRSSRGPPQLA